MLVHIDIDVIGQQISTSPWTVLRFACGNFWWRSRALMNEYCTKQGYRVYGENVLGPNDLSLNPREITCIGCLCQAYKRLALYEARTPYGERVQVKGIL
jgi:hypothetical protein